MTSFRVLRENYKDSRRLIPVSDQNRVDLALWAAWRELNEIRARDGVPYTHMGGKACVDEEYFSSVVDELADLLGSDAKPWPPDRCRDEDGICRFGADGTRLSGE